MDEVKQIGRKEKAELAAKREANVIARKQAIVDTVESAALKARSEAFEDELESYGDYVEDEPELKPVFVMPPNRIEIPEAAFKFLPGPPESHGDVLARWMKNYRRPANPKKNIKGGEKMRARRPQKGNDYIWTFQEPWMLEAFRQAWCQEHNSRGGSEQIADGKAYLKGDDVNDND